MDDLIVHGQSIARDRDGYLRSLSDWDDDVAAALAGAEGISLAPAHREVIEVIRHFHAEHHISPATRILVKIVGRALGPEKGTSTYLMQLFPSRQSPALVIARIAGLPRPTNCL